MKKYTFLFVMAFASLLTQAQLVFQGGDTSKIAGFADNSTTFECKGYLQNNGSSTVTVKWMTIDSSGSAGWENVGTCDPHLCYQFELGTQHSFSLQKDSVALMKTDIISHCVGGNGFVKIRLWDASDSTHTAFIYTFLFKIKANVAVCGSATNGLSDINATHISLYPNPVKSVLEIRLPQTADNGKIEIYNLIGSKVFDKAIKENDLSPSFDLNNLETGVYLCRVYDNGNLIATKKFTKE